MGWVRSADLPFEASPPMAAWSHRGRLHVAAVDLARQAACAVHLDAEGRAGDPRPLSVEYPICLTACASRLLLTGATAGSQPVLIELALDATTVASSPVPISSAPTLGPRPLCVRGEPVLIWEATYGESGRLFLCPATPAGMGTPVHRDLQRLTAGLDAVSTGDEVVLARISGPERRLDLIRLAVDLADRGAAQLAEGATSTVLAAGADRVGVAWSSGRELRFGWVDRSLRAGGGPSVLASVDRGAVLKSLRAVGSDDGWLALLYQVLRLADAEAAGAGPELRHPERRVEDFLCLVAPGATAAAVHERLPPGYWGGATGGWLGSRFLLLRGGRQAAVSIYEVGGAS